MNPEQSLPEISPELVALVAASPHGKLLLSPERTVLAVSDAYLTMMGTTRAAIIGRDVRDVLKSSPSIEDLVTSLDITLRTRLPHRMGIGEFWPPGKTQAREAQEDREFDVVNAPVIAPDGRVLFIIHDAGEVLDSKASQFRPLPAYIALQAAEARLRSVLQTVPDAMLIIDERGRIESLSTTAERLFGYSTDEVIGRNITVLMPSPFREQHDGYLKRYLKTGEGHIIGIGRVVTGQRKDGTTFPMHLTVGELRSADRHYFTGFMRDLTEQQLTEGRLRELQSEVTHMSRFTALGEMASTLAHEINQPLTAIANYLRGCNRLLEKMEDGPASMLRDAVGKAGDQALRAGDIIRRLREFVARGETERHVENLPKLIEDASTLGLLGAREYGIAVSFRLDPGANLVIADRIQIQQVLVNLIRNAIDVMTESTHPRELEISTKSNVDDMIEVSVSDSGAGLAPEVAARLFEPFVTTKRAGMGLGLSICRTIVEAHGGKIWVDVPPQGGTSFRFTLRAAAFGEPALAP